MPARRVLCDNVKRHITRNSFSEKALAVVRGIPRGSVLTYKEVARRAGNLRAARAVGSIMKRNRDPMIPCHRVVCSDGSLGEYNRGVEAKARLLLEEGALKKMERKIVLQSESWN
ncbi:MAG: MGMT family protein [Candidatus Colwellbacteria bacterium]|nr:MGMT family protein [Candidatus Colwellbacteria bacterium]